MDRSELWGRAFLLGLETFIKMDAEQPELKHEGAVKLANDSLAEFDKVFPAASPDTPRYARLRGDISRDLAALQLVRGVDAVSNIFLSRGVRGLFDLPDEQLEAVRTDVQNKLACSR